MLLITCDGVDGLHRLSQDGLLLVEMPLRSWDHAGLKSLLPITVHVLLLQGKFVFKWTFFQKREDTMYIGTLSLQYYSLNSSSIPGAHGFCQYRRV